MLLWGFLSSFLLAVAEDDGTIDSFSSCPYFESIGKFYKARLGEVK
jgi:hypothetical protein